MGYNRPKPELFTHEGDREASPPERGNGPLPWSGPQTEFVERRPEKNANAKPSTRHGFETIRLRASLLQAHLSIDTVSSIALQAGIMRASERTNRLHAVER